MSKPKAPAKSQSSKPQQAVPPTKPTSAPGLASSKKAEAKENLISEQLNALVKKAKARKRAVDFLSDADASDREEGDVTIGAEPHTATKKNTGPQKKRQKSDDKKDPADKGVTGSKTVVAAEDGTEVAKLKKNKRDKKLVFGTEVVEKTQHSNELGKEKAAQTLVAPAKTSLTKAGKKVSESLLKAAGTAGKVTEDTSAPQANGKGGYESDDDTSDEDDVEDGDQTAALLKGFESSEDDESSEDEDADYQKGTAVPKLDISKKKQKKLETLKKKGSEGSTGVIYIG
jgi:nucleolar protein 15